MNSLLYYILQVIAASGILYLYYYVALRNKRFHQYNRFYLLAAMLLSIFIPFLNIPVYFNAQETSTSIVLQTLTAISAPAANEPATMMSFDTASSYSFTISDILSYAYIIIIGLAILKIVLSLYRIRKISRSYPVEKIGDINFVNTHEAGTPFSFFRWLFWDRSINVNSQNGERIFRHELFHIREKHTLDIMFTELLTAILWINPVFHLMKKEIRAIHEFLADQYAVEETDKWDYAELLLMHTLRTKQSLVNPFFYNQVKRRIAMITNPKKTSHQYLRKMLVLPIAAIVIVLFAFKYINAAADPVIPSSGLITVVLDAGHGGTDPGAKSPDAKYDEASLSLEIAKTIQELAASYNVKVIMTRQDEHFPGNATNKDDGLRKRVEIANEIKPDLFLSLHLNSSDDKEYQENASGMEAYVSGKRDDEKGKMLASAILQQLSPVYQTNTKWKSRSETGVWVLDHNSCPSVLLQCGFITNKKDISFISDKTNREKVAKSILQGIVNYKSSVVNRPTAAVTDTIPNFLTLKGNISLYINDNVILIADSLSLHDNSSTNFNTIPQALFIIDGEEKDADFIQHNSITGGVIDLWPKDDAEAIKLYGQKAKNGLVIVTNAKIVHQPPSVYYKALLDKIEAEKKKSNANFEKAEPQNIFPGGSDLKAYFVRTTSC